MNILKRILITTMLFATMLTFNPFGSVFSANSAAVAEAAVPPTADPQADIINWIYRVHDGWLQKRRWNYTKGYWVDPNWITIKKYN